MEEQYEHCRKVCDVRGFKKREEERKSNFLPYSSTLGCRKGQ